MACGLGVAVICAKLAMQGGATVLTVVTVRTVAAVAALALVLALQRVSWVLPARQRRLALALGILLCLQAGGLLGSVHFMAPPLAILVYDLYPTITVIVEALTGRERFTARRLGALVLSFSGLVLVLNTGELRPNAPGVVAALVAAFSFAAILLVSSRGFPPGDPRPRMLHMTGSASLILLAACALTGEVAFPGTATGWIGLAGLCLVFPLAFTGVFVSVGLVGPARTGMLLNFEPVAVAVLSAVLFGQLLTGLQLVGGAMVIAAILVLQWAPGRKS